MAQQHYNPILLLDTLYCSEEHWEEQDELDIEFEYDNVSLNNTTINTTTCSLLETDMFWDDEELKSLLNKEQQNPLYIFLQTNPVLETARRESIEWILKVNAHYSFSALTAVLAVNYLDRFLFSFRFQNEKPWMTQLAAVACLSLAAKMEETHVPLLLDLQVCFILTLAKLQETKRTKLICFEILFRLKRVDTCLKQKRLKRWKF